MAPAPDIVYFDATLTPNRSLSPRAFTILMVIMGVTSFASGMMFVSMGAYPVMGFFGLDALAIWAAFRWNFRQLRQVTKVRITAAAIELHHERPGTAPRQASIPTAFARVDLAYPDRQPSELRISHGASVWVIGRFLTPTERKSLLQALKAAIGRARMERFPA